LAIKAEPPEPCEPAPRKQALWKALFAPPEFRPSPAGHQNRCDLCQAIVDPFEKRCPACGGVWRVAETNPHRRRNYLFGISSMAISVAFGALCHSLFADYIQHSLHARAPSDTLNPEMLHFLTSYLWLLVTVATLFLSTFLFERLDTAPSGRWVRPERSVDRR
jgi:hypothetical protein